MKDDENYKNETILSRLKEMSSIFHEKRKQYIKDKQLTIKSNETMILKRIYQLQ